MKVRNVPVHKHFRSMPGRRDKSVFVKYHNRTVRYYPSNKILRRIYYTPIQPKEAGTMPKKDHIFEPKYDGVRCLSPIQNIETETGPIKIRDIVNKKMNIKIKSFNFNNNTFEYKPIINWYKNGLSKDFIKITLNNIRMGKQAGTLICTPNHRIFTPFGEVIAGELNIGDEVFTDKFSLSDLQRKILYGTLLGDSAFSIDKRSPTYQTPRLYFQHSIKQKEYALFKSNIFNQLKWNIKNTISQYGYPAVRCTSESSSIFIEDYNCLYPNKKKIISEEWLEQIGIPGLAFWIMDDGSLMKSNPSPRMHLYTNSFDLDSVELMQNKLKEIFDLNTSIYNSKGYYLAFNKESTKRLIHMISPYIHPALRYKIKNYGQFRPDIFNDNKTLFTYKIKSIKPFIHQRTRAGNISRSQTYDIEVKDNHNYFTGGFLVHNSVLYTDKKKGIALINRRDVNMTKKYPELQNLHKTIHADAAVLDGEVIIKDYDSPYGDFKKLATREHRLYDIEEYSKKYPATFMAFDILEKNNKPLVQLPLFKRKKILDNVIPDDAKNIKEIKITTEPKSLLNRMKKAKGEGIVAKHIAGKYPDSWNKIKLLKENDVVLLGYTEGEGKRKGLFGALLMGVWNGKQYRYVGKVGTGFNDKQIKEIKRKLDRYKTHKEGNKIYVKPKFIARVSFLKKTPDGKYREPRFKGFRQDIKPTQTHPTRIRNFLSRK